MKVTCLSILIKLIVQLIVPGILGDHGLLVIRHAEVESVPRSEQKRLKKLMEVIAQEKAPKNRIAVSKSAQVTFPIFFQLNCICVVLPQLFPNNH